MITTASSYRWRVRRLLAIAVEQQPGMLAVVGYCYFKPPRAV
jgi:hypothetical protein